MCQNRSNLSLNKTFDKYAKAMRFVEKSCRVLQHCENTTTAGIALNENLDALRILCENGHLNAAQWLFAQGDIYAMQLFNGVNSTFTTVCACTQPSCCGTTVDLAGCRNFHCRR